MYLVKEKIGAEEDFWFLCFRKRDSISPTPHLCGVSSKIGGVTVGRPLEIGQI